MTSVVFTSSLIIEFVLAALPTTCRLVPCAKAHHRLRPMPPHQPPVPFLHPASPWYRHIYLPRRWSVSVNTLEPTRRVSGLTCRGVWPLVCLCKLLHAPVVKADRNAPPELSTSAPRTAGIVCAGGEQAGVDARPKRDTRSIRRAQTSAKANLVRSQDDFQNLMGTSWSKDTSVIKIS